MKYKGLLLDIDNTLYDYHSVHKMAKEKALMFCAKNFSIDLDKLYIAYENARKRVHIELSETASSHNRLLYFQKMLEFLDINPLQYAYDVYNQYWDSFLNNLIPFDGVYDLLQKYRMRICLVTDLTALIQYRKIEKLKLYRYCNKIVTSEESGREKPHPYIFMLALKKLNLTTDEVIMIGDSFQKDILGALGLQIRSIWFNHAKKEINYNNGLIKEVTEFKDILELI